MNLVDGGQTGMNIKYVKEQDSLIFGDRILFRPNKTSSSSKLFNGHL